jgi:hypothetical protein
MRKNEKGSALLSRRRSYGVPPYLSENRAGILLPPVGVEARFPARGPAQVLEALVGRVLSERLERRRRASIVVVEALEDIPDAVKVLGAFNIVIAFGG